MEPRRGPQLLEQHVDEPPQTGGEIARNSAVHGETTADGKSLVAYGGGVGLLRSTGTITGGSIEGNTGSSQGGGIYAQNSTLRISGCTIDGNAASGFGGGIFLSSTPLTVQDTDITGNRTDGYGGALYAYGASEVSLGSGTRIEGNSAGYGGGLANSSTGTVTVDADALLAGNLATEGAGIAEPGPRAKTTYKGEARTASEPCGPPPSMPAACFGRRLPRAPAARRW